MQPLKNLLADWWNFTNFVPFKLSTSKNEPSHIGSITFWTKLKILYIIYIYSSVGRRIYTQQEKDVKLNSAVY